MMALFIGQDAFAKTKLPLMTMQAALTGSLKGAVTVTLTKPSTSPLLKWARAASDKARQERMARVAAPAAPVQQADESDLTFSRDRD